MPTKSNEKKLALYPDSDDDGLASDQNTSQDQSSKNTPKR
jgi:hypothetical protein